MDQLKESRLKTETEESLDQSLKSFQETILMMGKQPVVNEEDLLKQSKEFLELLENSEKKYCAFIKSVFDETSDADPLTQFQTQAGLQSKINQYNYYQQALNEIEEKLNPESEMVTPRNAMDED